MTTEVLREGQFDPGEFVAELAAAPTNLDVGTALLLENHRVKVWEVRLAPGERGAFHSHTRDYFWTVVDPGEGLQRLADGTLRVRRYETGQTVFGAHSAEEPMIHDLENVGSTTLRFVTVELLDPS